MDRSPPRASNVQDVSWLSRQVQALADALFPGNGGAELRVIVGGREAVIVGVQSADAAGDGLGDMERDILDALEEAGPSVRLTGEQLAERAGYTFDATFRRACASLRKAGRIKNHQPGYSLPE